MSLPNYQYGTIPTPDEFNAFIRPRFDRDPNEDEYPGHLQRLLDDSLSNEIGNIKPDFRKFDKGLFVSSGVGLSIVFKGGVVELINNTKIVVLDGNITLPNNSTVWVYVGDSGVVSYSVGYPNNVIVMAKVTTFANAITNIDDYRDRKIFKIARHIFSGNESTEGLLKIATENEVNAGQDDTKAVSSLKLDLWKRYNNLVSSKPGGNTFYVDEKNGNADDSLQNPGTDYYSPFKTIERAMLEVARRSYKPNAGNQIDIFDEATVFLAPGNYVIDNRPGVSDYVQIQPLLPTSQAIQSLQNIVQPLQVGTIQTYNPQTKILTLTNTTQATYEELKPEQQIFNNNNGKAVIDVAINNTGSYKIKNIVGDWSGIGNIVVVSKYSYFNPPTGGLLIPRGCSIVAADLRKTKITPRYVGDVSTWELNNPYDPNQPDTAPDNSNIGRTAIFKTTGSCLITGLTFFDNKNIKSTHHLCSSIEPASTLELSNESYGYYAKIERAFSSTITPPMNAGELDAVNEESIIVAPTNNNTSIDDDGFLLINSVYGSSAYVFNCSLRSRFGLCGISCDGSKIQGLKSIVTAQFTNVSLQSDPRAFVNDANSPGGKAYKDKWRHFSFSATNDGYMQIVSCFVICAGIQYRTLSGGELSVTNSCSNFGDISLFADGYSNSALPQDSGGTITKIIPPKPIIQNNLTIPISGFSATNSTTTKLYIEGTFEQKRIEPFTLLPNELIYVKGVGNAEYSATLVSSGNLISSDNNGYYLNVLSTDNQIYANRNSIDTLPIVIKRNPDERKADDRIFWFRLDGVPLSNRRPLENYVLKFNSSQMNGLQINKNLFISAVKNRDNNGNDLPSGSYYLSFLNADGVNDKNSDLYPELNVDAPTENSVTSKSYVAAKKILLALTIPEVQALTLLQTSISEVAIVKDNLQVTTYPKFLKPSLIRCSGHTWEWSGYNNYSSALPKFQTRVLTLAESVNKMKFETNCGRVYSTGMDQDGNFIIGDKIIDLKTGNETNINAVEDDSKVFKRVTVTERLLMFPNSTLDLKSVNINFDLQSKFLNPISTESGVYSTTESPGFVELATDAEAIAGTDSKRAITPKSLKPALDLKQNSITAVTLADTQTLTNKTLTSPIINNPTGIVKGNIGLNNVPNLDTSNPANISTNSNYRFVSDEEKAYWNNKVGQLPPEKTPAEWRDMVDAAIPVGRIEAFFGSTLPSSRWEWAHGQEVLRSAISAELVADLVARGVPYSGNGTTTVRLPDSRGRVFLGAGGDYALGANGGAATHVLTINEMPSHNHTADHTHTINDPTHTHVLTLGGSQLRGYAEGNGTRGPGAELTTVPGETAAYALNSSSYTGIAINSTSGLTTSNQGAGQSHNNMQPFLASNFIIKVK